jgi:hypothetical protein
MLGLQQEELALPILVQMLTAYLPSETQATTLRDEKLENTYSEYCNYWRVRAVLTLSDWKRPAFAPIFCQAFATLQYARQLWQLQGGEGGRGRMWCSCQDELAYALGRIQAFGALTFLGLPEDESRLAILHLALGALEARKHYGFIKLLASNDGIESTSRTTIWAFTRATRGSDRTTW